MQPGFTAPEEISVDLCIFLFISLIFCAVQSLSKNPKQRSEGIGNGFIIISGENWHQIFQLEIKQFVRHRTGANNNSCSSELWIQHHGELLSNCKIHQTAPFTEETLVAPWWWAAAQTPNTPA